MAKKSKKKERKVTKRFEWKTDRERAAWLTQCQVSTVMIYSRLHLQYEVCRCRWECIEMEWVWTHPAVVSDWRSSWSVWDGLRVNSQFAHGKTINRNFYQQLRWGLYEVPLPNTEKFSETLKPHCCFRNDMFPHRTEAMLRIPLSTYHQSSSVIAMFFQEGRSGLCYSVHNWDHFEWFYRAMWRHVIWSGKWNWKNIANDFIRFP